ncbi:MAG TPA: PAS domain-containing protein [Solirubrobacteraceae bacterium]|jgi:PAS domain-containing protein|nr:PAS domain-containing protein [Solirubrobacteraceae bacterium]
MSAQRPLELILARNLLCSISTPAFLVGEGGALLFYNDAAEAMLGRRFEDTSVLAAEDWTSAFGPLDREGDAIPFEQIPATMALRSNRPYHGRFAIRGAGGRRLEIAASAIPIVGSEGATGAIVIFWPIEEGGDALPLDDGAGAGASPDLGVAGTQELPGL